MRIVFFVTIEDHNLLVEIRKEPYKEIIIYDSMYTGNSKLYSIIMNIFRDYIEDEMRNKTKKQKNYCQDFA